MSFERTRRSVLQSIGGAGLGSIVLSETTTALEDREIVELVGDERKEVLERAKSDDGFGSIVEYFQAKQRSISYKRAIVNRVIPKDESQQPYEYVVVPLVGEGQSSDKQMQANVFWTNRDLSDIGVPSVLGHEAEKEVTSSSDEWKVTVYTAVSGEVSERSPPNQDPGDGGGGEEGCTVEIVSCDSWDWTCIVSIAASIVGSASGCSACLMDPTKISCGLCLVAVVGGSAGTAGCAEDGDALQDECEIEYSWYPKDELPASFDYPYDCHN